MDRNEAVARILAHAAASQSGSDGAAWTRYELHDWNGLRQHLDQFSAGEAQPGSVTLPTEPEEII